MDWGTGRELLEAGLHCHPESPNGVNLRIRIVQKPKGICIDGLQMDQFRMGQEYDVGWRFGSLMLLEGWAEPVGFEERRPTTKGEPQAKAADTRRRHTPRRKR
jgi:hypothetical protein